VLVYITTAISSCTLTLHCADWSCWAVRACWTNWCGNCGNISLVRTGVWIINYLVIAIVSINSACISWGNIRSWISGWIVVCNIGVSICAWHAISIRQIIPAKQSIVGSLSLCNFRSVVCHPHFFLINIIKKSFCICSYICIPLKSAAWSCNTLAGCCTRSTDSTIGTTWTSWYGHRRKKIREFKWHFKYF
jgi:hypothetical protein